MKLSRLGLVQCRDIQIMLPGTARDMHNHVGTRPDNLRYTGYLVLHEAVKIRGPVKEEYTDDINVTGASA